MTRGRGLPAEDEINHPSHYQIGEYEVVRILEAWADQAQAAGFTGAQIYQGCSVLKYALRHPFKGVPVKDLSKVEKHMEWLMDLLKRGEEDAK